VVTSPDRPTPDAGRPAPDLDRLRRLLGGDEHRWLVERIRARLERGQPLDGTVTLHSPTDAQRVALERLLGRRPGLGASVSVALPEMEAILAHAGVAADLRSAVVALAGPLTDRAAEQASAAAAWEAAHEPVERAAADQPALKEWVAWVKDTGMLRRLSGRDPSAARRLAAQAADVLGRLPADSVPLSVLAERAVQDGHALDADRPLSTLVLRAAASLTGTPPGDGGEWRRTVWASVGVLSGELTSPVLSLGLPGDARTVTGRVLGEWSPAGQPVHLSARQLLRDPPALPVRGRLVFVCENPTVVAEAANRLGAASAPLVCTGGHPGAAAILLLRQLAAAGGELRYHGDFDWGGITIANNVIGGFAAHPWRLDAASYRRAAAPGGSVLRGTPVQAVWDPALAAAMLELSVKVEEERVLDDLLGDLAGTG
jgi:uncharacterized protein (TIGR02679 family)